MRAEVGDRLLIHGAMVGRPDHMAEIIEVRGADGGPPYVVRRGDGHQVLVFPGMDASVEHGRTNRPAENRYGPPEINISGTATNRARALYQELFRQASATRGGSTRGTEPRPGDDPCNYLG